MPETAPLLRSIRTWLAVFTAGLILSGITAFPLLTETGWLVRLSAALHISAVSPGLSSWVARVHNALAATNQRFPFLAYGTDWLAFAHLVIATAFIGPWRDPVRNRWVVDFGLIACLGVLPLAFIAGPLRGIPVFWRCIDASFGIIGAMPLLLVRRRIGALERTMPVPGPTHAPVTARSGLGDAAGSSAGLAEPSSAPRRPANS